MIVGVIFLWFWASVVLGGTLPPVLVDLKEPKLGQIDGSKLYEPNPPVTNSVLMVLEYFDENEKKLVDHQMTFELYGTVAPKTVDNFRNLARGLNIKFDDMPDEQVQHVSYKNTLFDHVEPKKLIQGGSIMVRGSPFSYNGASGSWAVENFDLKHDRPGRLCMANNGPEKQDSQFFITTGLEGEKDFDGKYVVFGQAVTGLNKLIEEIQYTPLAEGGKPVHDIKLKHILVWDLSIMDTSAEHNAYLEDLKQFRDGDLSKGVTMSSTFAEGKEEEKQLDEIMFNELHHPLLKVLIGVAVLLIVYMVVKTKRTTKSLRRA